MGIPFRGSDPDSEDQRGVTGLLIDFKARLLAGLAAPVAGGIATNAQAGVTQLATDAEALAGTNNLHPITALTARRAGMFRSIASFAELHANATLPEGTVAVLPSITTTNGKLFASYWRNTVGAWQPFVPLKALNAATLSDLKTIFASYSTIQPDPRQTAAFVIRDGATAANGWDEYIWLGTTTGFYLWRGDGSASLTYGSGYADSATSSLVVDGLVAHLDFETTNSGAATYATVIQVPTAIATPAGERLFGGAVNGATGWNLANFALQPNGAVVGLIFAGTSPFVRIGGSTTFKRVIPTA